MRNGKRTQFLVQQKKIKCFYKKSFEISSTKNIVIDFFLYFLTIFFSKIRKFEGIFEKHEKKNEKTRNFGFRFFDFPYEFTMIFLDDFFMTFIFFRTSNSASSPNSTVTSSWCTAPRKILCQKQANLGRATFWCPQRENETPRVHLSLQSSNKWGTVFLVQPHRKFRSRLNIIHTIFHKSLPKFAVFR